MKNNNAYLHVIEMCNGSSMANVEILPHNSGRHTRRFFSLLSSSLTTRFHILFALTTPEHIWYFWKSHSFLLEVQIWFVLVIIYKCEKRREHKANNLQPYQSCYNASLQSQGSFSLPLPLLLSTLHISAKTSTLDLFQCSGGGKGGMHSSLLMSSRFLLTTC